MRGCPALPFRLALPGFRAVALGLLIALGASGAQAQSSAKRPAPPLQQVPSPSIPAPVVPAPMIPAPVIPSPTIPPPLTPTPDPTPTPAPMPSPTPTPSPRAATPPAEIVVQNETDQVLYYLYIDPTGTTRRGTDRLNRDVVPPGTTYRARIGEQTACRFDITAIWLDRTEERRTDVDLCAAPRLVFGDPAMPTLEVAVGNNSDTAMRELYAVTPGPNPGAPASWGPDRLGTEIVPARGAFRMRIRTRECRFDLRAVYADDREEVKPGIDLCGERGVVFDRSGIPTPETRSLTLANRHLATVEQLFISSSEDGEWGPDRLGAVLLGVGEDTTLQLDVTCQVDIRVLFPNGGIEERRAYDVCENPRLELTPGWVVAPSTTPGAREGAATPEQGRAEPAGLTLRNSGPLPIVEIYAFPPGEPHGTDRLGRDILPVGETLELDPPDGDACAADLLVVFRDGRQVTRSGIDLCKAEEIELQ